VAEAFLTAELTELSLGARCFAFTGLMVAVVSVVLSVPLTFVTFAVGALAVAGDAALAVLVDKVTVVPPAYGNTDAGVEVVASQGRRRSRDGQRFP